MAHGLAVENWKWYVKSEDTGAAVAGPYSVESDASSAMARMDSKYGKLYTERVNVVALAVHRRVLPQEVVNGKRVPASRRQKR